MKTNRNSLCMSSGYDDLDIETQLIVAQHLEEEHGSVDVNPEFNSHHSHSLTVSGNHYFLSLTSSKLSQIYLMDVTFESILLLNNVFTHCLSKLTKVLNSQFLLQVYY